MVETSVLSPLQRAFYTSTYRIMNRQFDGFRVEYAETENVILTGPMTVDPT